MTWFDLFCNTLFAGNVYMKSMAALSLKAACPQSSHSSSCISKTLNREIYSVCLSLPVLPIWLMTWFDLSCSRLFAGNVYMKRKAALALKAECLQSSDSSSCVLKTLNREIYSVRFSLAVLPIWLMIDDLIRFILQQIICRKCLCKAYGSIIFKACSVPAI